MPPHARPDLRLHFLNLRTAIGQAEAVRAAEALTRHALAIPAIANAKTVGAYLPMRGELDTLPLLAGLTERGLATALPAIEPNTKLLRFHAWKPGDLLVTGPFGTRQPPAAAPDATPDTVLVPLLGFDAAGHRLGYGGGYYDATLKALRAARPTRVIGIAYALQHSPLPFPAHAMDETLDAVLTEEGWREFGGIAFEGM